ncbi:MAG TPA: porin PorA family protein [Micromonosporaceae bacterium]
MTSRTRTRLGIGLAVIGLLCLAAAAILRWAVLPSQARLPADENTARQYQGTAKVLVDPRALSTGDLRAALVTNAPVTAQRTVKTLATSGDVAEVQDVRTLTGGGRTLGQTTATYAVDRTTLAASPTHPADWNVTPAQGLTVSWPIGAEKKDYTGWVQETRSTTTLKYLRQEARQGVDTYVYQATTDPAPIKDPQVLDTLPRSLPVSTLTALSGAASIPPDVQAQLARLLPGLANPVPLSYTYQSQSTYWVQPTTGIVVDTQREEIRKAGASVAGKPVAAVLPVYDVSTAFTGQSAKAAATDAQDKADKINLYGDTLPLILLIVGAIVLVVGLALLLLTRRSGGGAPRGGHPTAPAPPGAAPGGPGPVAPEPPGPVRSWSPPDPNARRAPPPS